MAFGALEAGATGVALLTWEPDAVLALGVAAASVLADAGTSSRFGKGQVRRLGGSDVSRLCANVC